MLKETVNFKKIVTRLATPTSWPDHVVWNVKDTIFVRYCLIGQIQNKVKFMNTSTEHILQCNQSEPLAKASRRMVDLMNENVSGDAFDVYISK